MSVQWHGELSVDGWCDHSWRHGYMCMCNTWSGMASPSQKGRFGANAIFDLSNSKPIRIKLGICHSGLSPKCERSPTG